jgi:hypothetical protein
MFIVTDAMSSRNNTCGDSPGCPPARAYPGRCFAWPAVPTAAARYHPAVMDFGRLGSWVAQRFLRGDSQPRRFAAFSRPGQSQR